MVNAVDFHSIVNNLKISYNESPQMTLTDAINSKCGFACSSFLEVLIGNRQILEKLERKNVIVIIILML